MSVRMSLLAMIAGRPSYGYLLRAEFDRRTGADRPLNIGQVYKALELLERDGLAARSTRTDADGHVFYEATESGRIEVESWLLRAEPQGMPARSDLAIKVAIATTLPGVDVDRMLRAQREAALSTLQRLTRETAASGDTAASPGELLARQLVTDAVLLEAETEVRWLDQVEQRIRHAREAGTTLEVPFDTAPPRRGRPAGTGRQTRKEAAS